ncbi:hypothetical protein ACMA1I_06280 [Pontibacter sp. 13R65]|uniref:hypothetical protein n=1 Tax=Pontibacter sp. 13R65 TaxID=3127458 RepID=UPI00301C79A0
MITIARNQFYEFSYEPDKNRIHFRMLGYWKSPEVVPEYLKDWGKTLEMAKPGFTLIADVRDMITHPVTVKQLHEKAIESCVDAGITYVAEISPLDKIAVLQTGGMAKEKQVPYIKVLDYTLAGHILDQLQQEK